MLTASRLSEVEEMNLDQCDDAADIACGKTTDVEGGWHLVSGGFGSPSERIR